MYMCKCKVCGKTPDKINEYVECARHCNSTPKEFVMHEEGTYNPVTGLFYCTDCYIKVGMPYGIA